MIERMIKHLPKYERKSKLIREILKATSIELDGLNAEIKQSYDEFFIDTAIKTLRIHTKDLGIKFPPNLSFKQQREIIIAQYLAAFHQTTEEKLITIVQAFVDCDVEINPTDEAGVFEIALIGDQVRLDNQGGLRMILSRTIPAHLAFFLAFVLKSADLTMESVAYSYAVLYPIANYHWTEGIKGAAFEVGVSVDSEPFHYPVLYPMTGEHVLDGIKGEQMNDSVAGIVHNVAAGIMPYPVCGEFYGGGY